MSVTRNSGEEYFRLFDLPAVVLGDVLPNAGLADRDILSLMLTCEKFRFFMAPNLRLKKLRWCLQHEQYAEADNIYRQFPIYKLFKLLHHVAFGQQAAVEAMLAESTSCVFSDGKLVDYAQLTFESINIIEYAAWAGDMSMLRAILGFLDDEQCARVLEILTSLELNGTAHGVSYNYKPLFSALEEYIANYDQLDSFSRRNFWCQKVGAQLRKVPAHVAQEFCNAHPFYQLKRKFPGLTSKRNMTVLMVMEGVEKEELRWYPVNPLHGVGVDFAPVMSGRIIPIPHSPIHPALALNDCPREVAELLLFNLRELRRQRKLDLTDIKIELENLPRKRYKPDSDQDLMQIFCDNISSKPEL